MDEIRVEVNCHVPGEERKVCGGEQANLGLRKHDRIVREDGTGHVGERTSSKTLRPRAAEGGGSTKTSFRGKALSARK